MNAIIIDFDGTIANSFDHVLNFLLQQAGRDPATVSPEERKRLKGLSMKDLAVQVGVSRWRLPIVFFRGKAQLTKQMNNIPPFKGIQDVLAACHANGYQLYIVSSNSRRNINRFLSEHGMGGYFRRVYGNAGWFKGRNLRKVLARNKLIAEKTIYVGDEVRDIVGAKQAGMPMIAVTWGFGSEEQLMYFNPTIVVRTPEQLQKALLDWASAA